MIYYKKAFQKLVTGLSFIFLTVQAFSQTAASMPGKINIASPNAAAIGKYGDIPVNYHTGIPNINIPLYDLKSGNLNLPISLSYHASGLKVEENASWVGAGWSLNAGGVISRTVMDKPDEKQTTSLAQTYGYFSDYGIQPFNGTIPDPNEKNTAYDDEPDLFFFSFGGYSGKFYFNDDRTPVLVPEQDIKIEYNYTSGTWTGSPGMWAGLGRCIESFTITTPDGTKYYFGIPQTAVQSPYCDPIEVTSTFSSTGGTSYSQVISSWYLYKIVSADGNFSVDLKYQRDKYAYYTYTNPITIEYSGSGVNYDYSLIKNFMAGVRLSKISSLNESVDFAPGTVRQDLSRWASGLDETITDNINESSPALGSINVSDGVGNCIKKYIFSYDYFADNTSPVHPNFSGVISDKKRLKLLSLQEQTCDASITIPPYIFNYYTEQVPRRLSFSKDHWGYNNGVSTNSELYPALYDNNGLINGSTPIANRESAWPAMRAGTLNKITYPTGGSTSFDFEANTFTINTIVNGQTVPVDQAVGGLRIKTIANFDPVANKNVVTQYNYTSSVTGMSSGVLFSRPVYIQILRNDWVKKGNFWGGGYNSEGCWDHDPATETRYRTPIIFSDNPLRPMETTQGYHIGYGEVKVSQTGNGYSIYKYNVDPTVPPYQINRESVAVTKINNPGTCDPGIPNFPAAPLDYDFHRGELIYEGHFTQAGNTVNEKEYQSLYDLNPVTTPGITRFTIPASQDHPVFIINTPYEIKTGHMTQSTIIERNYGLTGQTPVETTTQTFYESNYHHQPTRVVTTDSKGQIIEKKIKYVFDYRVSTFENTPICNSASTSFLSYINSLYYSIYQTQFMSCSGDIWGCTGAIDLNFYNQTMNTRQSYISCRRTNYTDPVNTFQTNHNNAKSAADNLLKPILWMQDNFMNLPVETSTWKGGLLTGAQFNQYTNDRDDAAGVYLNKTQNIELTTPSSSFTPSAVSSNGVSLTKDSRYIDQNVYTFYKGNLVSILPKDGVPYSYLWGYNHTLPVVQVANANNTIHEAVSNTQLTQNLSYTLGNGYPNGWQEIFTQTQSGNIILSISQLPPNGIQVTLYYSLVGPGVNQNGYLCNSNSSTGPCGSTPSSISFSNMPAGQYTLNFTAYANPSGSFSFLYSFSYSYVGLGVITTGSQDFFYEGFEDNLSASTGFAHTGVKYLNGNYTTSFSPSGGGSYIIQWWSYNNSKWSINQQPYTQGMQLSGIIDDIRIFPANALMTTYTYSPPIGMTSQVDPNGRTLFYSYDQLGRLLLVRDQDQNIIKKICYNYAGQTENCNQTGTAQWVATGATRCKPCPANGNYITNIQQVEQKDVNPQSPTYNQSQWIDNGTSSNCVISADWQNISAVYCQQSGGHNTGYQVQDQKDMNPCSSTYNSTRTVTIGYNTTACPLPTCTNCTGNDKKCINGVCETGTWSVIMAVKVNKTTWQCTYAYCFSDGTTSSYTQTTTGSTACFITCVN